MTIHTPLVLAACLQILNNAARWLALKEPIQ